MRMLEANLFALAQCDPACAELLKQETRDTELELCPSRRGGPTAALHRAGAPPRALYSRFDPARQAEREAALFDTAAARAAGAVLVLGLGLGYHLDALMRLLPDTQFVVVERRPTLARAALARTDWCAALRTGRLCFVVGAAPDQARVVAARAAHAHVFRHPTLFAADMDYYYPLLRAHHSAAHPGQGLRVLSFSVPGAAVPFSFMDCHEALRALGHTVRTVELHRHMRDREVLDALHAAVTDFAPDLVFTIDVTGLVPEVLRPLGIPIISWFFDDPVGFFTPDADGDRAQALSLESLGSNYRIFTWDRTYVEPLLTLGAPHAAHLPFAANPRVFRPMEMSDEQRGQFACDVSFAGNSGSERQGFTRRDVIGSLHAFDVRVYGDAGWEQVARGGVRFLGRIHNREELPLLYTASRVNLNLTAKQLRTAVPIRVFDILAAGGFLISDYRADFIELFDDRREAVCCRDMDDLPDMIRYWLDRPDERRAVARAGRQKVLAAHTFEHRIAYILDSVQCADSRSAPPDSAI